MRIKLLAPVKLVPEIDWVRIVFQLLPIEYDVQIPVLACRLFRRNADTFDFAELVVNLQLL